MKTEQLQIVINRDAVFQMVDCREESTVYDAMLEAYEELLPEVLACADGRCIFELGEITEADATAAYPAGTRVIYVLSTVGGALSDLSSRMFAEGEYVKGALADAMADSALFELEAQWMPELKAFCREHGVGIRARLEAPNDLPMTVQQTAFEVLNAREELGLAITTGFMYDPMKSSCLAFVVTEDVCQFHAGHDCRRCPSVNCKLRRVPAVKIMIRSAKGTKEIWCEEKESILAAYQRQVEYASAVCGGKGTCGKCRIRVLEGTLPVTESDRKCFSERELTEGYRLSCRAFPDADCVIEVCFADEAEFEVLDAFADRKQNVEKRNAEKRKAEKRNAEKTSAAECAADEKSASGKASTEQRVGIAIDIGTTTLAAQLIDLTDGCLLSTASSMNHQRAFGADVVSRMEASMAGKGRELQNLIRADLQRLIGKLIRQSGISAKQVEKIMIGGNTTMGHLLMGYSCATLGVYPFTPVDISTIRGRFSDVIGTEYMGMEALDCDVWLLPGISTYVGGDIVAGLYACEFEQQETVNLLVDLGTNGEMAIGNRERLLVTSTAAGPAFEGGNISCGTGSIPGAICHVKIGADRRTAVETIQNQSPVGICGTGVIEITAELLKAGIVEETGLLDEEYFEEGYPVAITPEGNEIWFTQKDVREIQLAKSAVRAGVETLIRRYGVSCDEIGTVYLAGGMGFQLDRDAAVTIGLIPAELKGKIHAVGNSSLAGAVRALLDDSWQKTMEGLVASSKEAHLSIDPDFNEFYMTYMMFGEE